MPKNSEDQKPQMREQDTSVDVSSKDNILGIIRTESQNQEQAKSAASGVGLVGKPKIRRAKDPYHIGRCVDPEPYIKAVKYVKEERRRAGLPAEVKEELDLLE